MWKSAFAFMVALLAINQSLLAGLRVDLRPVQAPPGPDGYTSGSVVDIDVFLVDTGNPQGDIALRGVFLDFTDSDAAFTYPDPDGAGPLVAGDFSWINPFTVGATFPSLPQVSWVYPLPTAMPIFQIVVPDNGEVQLGSLKVNIGQNGLPFFQILDAMNDDSADPNFGASVTFGFGGPGDPVTTWRAFDGQLTGGTLNMSIPEPGCALLLLVGGLMRVLRRSTIT